MLYGYCCSYKHNDTSSELTLNVGDVFGKPWYAWVKYFTVTAVYHLDVSDPYDIFFEATVEDVKSISTSTHYMKSTFVSTRELLTTYGSDIRIAGAITENEGGLYGVSILDVSSDSNGKYLATKTSPFTGTAEPSKTGYTFTPESVEYDALTKYAVDDYVAEAAAPSEPTSPTPKNGDTETDFSGLELSWEDGGGADTYNIYIGKTGDLDLVSSTQEGVTYTATLSELATIFGADPINQKIYWRVDATNDAGTTTGDEWNFDPRPAKVSTTTPVTGASGITLDQTTGTWESPSANTYSYDIYYGTLSGFLSLLESGVDDTSYALRSTNWPLYGEAYYWRVDAANDFGTTQGDELDFTTLIFYPPTPSGVTWSDPGNTAGYTGTPLGTNNMLTCRRLVGAAANCLWIEV